MRLSALAVAVLTVLECATAFRPLLPSTKAMIAKPTSSFLKYSIVYHSDEDDNEQKQEEKPQQDPRETQKSADGDVASFEGYSDYDEMKEVTKHLNVDAYDSMAGGIIPGQQLSSLCSDD